MELRDLTLTDAHDWRALAESGSWCVRDAYHHPSWYATWERSGYGEAHCLHGEEGGEAFLYPFLLRPVEGYDLPRPLHDVETSYGYGGLLTRSAAPSAAFLARANDAIDAWMREKGVVAELVRVHPDIPQDSRAASLLHARDDAFLDLADRTLDEVWENQLSSTTRRSLRLAERGGLVAKVETDLRSALPRFAPIYLECAKRRQMDPFYWFPAAYYDAFAEEMQGRAFLITVHHEGREVASSIWVRGGDTLHYYLGGTRDDARRLPCSDAYYWAAVRQAVFEGLRRVHFGGGLSAAPDDTLFRFKSKYANVTKRVHVGMRVHLPFEYETLCGQWARRHPALVARYGRHLLRYRNQPKEAETVAR